MMACSQLTILLFLCLTLVGCKDYGKKQGEEPFYVHQIEVKQTSPFYGEWDYSFPFYSCELTINVDSTFKFHSQGCMGHSYTEGNWINDGDELILTSYSKYKQEVTPIEIIVTSVQTKPNKIRNKPKNSKSKYSYSFDPSSFNTTASFIWPDTSDIYFDKKRLRLRRSELIEIDENRIETKVIYNNRKFTSNTGLPKLPSLLPAIFDSIQ